MTSRRRQVRSPEPKLLTRITPLGWERINLTGSKKMFVDYSSLAQSYVQTLR